MVILSERLIPGAITSIVDTGNAKNLSVQSARKIAGKTVATMDVEIE